MVGLMYGVGVLWVGRRPLVSKMAGLGACGFGCGCREWAGGLWCYVSIWAEGLFFVFKGVVNGDCSHRIFVVFLCCGCWW